jgi:prenyltransferase beta subunit
MLRVFSDAKSPAFVESETPKKELDVRGLLRWSASMQAMPIEGGGFRGRTNKLVDGCYSWWCGGLFPVIDGLLEEESPVEDELFDRSTSLSTLFLSSSVETNSPSFLLQPFLVSSRPQPACKNTSP